MPTLRHTNLILLGAFWILLLIQPAFSFNAPSSCLSGAGSGIRGRCETAVLCEPDDPYRALAMSIADSEKLQLFNSIGEALQARPTYLLWVVSPGNCSYARFYSFTRTLQDHKALISWGVITGSTAEDARALYARGKHASADTCAAINAARPSALMPASILQAATAHQTARLPLARQTVLDSFKKDYVTVSCHGTPNAFHLADDLKIASADIPELPGTVMDVYACNTASFWTERNIARACIDRGASAYSGFVNSPLDSWVMGSYDRMPSRFTHPDFPVGCVALLNNLSGMKDDSLTYSYILCGDPRTALSSEPPYTLVSDQTDGSSSTLTYVGAPAGVIGVMIPGAARFEDVRIPGVGSCSDRDLFPNARVQAANINGRKYVLFVHDGGDFTVELHEKTSLPVLVWSHLSKSLDYSFFCLYAPNQGAYQLLAILIGVGGVWTYYRARRMGNNGRQVLASVAIAFLMTAPIVVYSLVHQYEVVVTARNVALYPCSWIGLFALSLIGAYNYLGARKRLGALVALLFPVAVPLCGMVVYTCYVTMANSMVSGRCGMFLWGYRPLALIAASLPLQILWFTTLCKCARYDLRGSGKGVPDAVPAESSLEDGTRQ